MYRVSSFLQYFAWALIAGSVLATVWVNTDPESYYDLIEFRLFEPPAFLFRMGNVVTFRDLAADVLMTFFLFYLGKELWEAFRLERGAMRRKRGGIPVLGAAGGLIGAALVWIAASAVFQSNEEVTAFTGWTVPLGSDVVLGYLFARWVFGPGSPAVHVMLLMMIAMDLAGLLLMGIATAPAGMQPLWLILPAGSAFAAWFFFARHLKHAITERERRRALQLWPYLLAGIASWIGVAASGLPPALGLLPVLPVIPHADRAFGMFAQAEEFLHDPLNRFAHLLVWPLVMIMALFGLTHGGIDLAGDASTTWILLAALWIGKPAGILVGALIVAPRLGYRLPQAMRRRDIGLIAGIAGIGFTLPILSLEQALPGGFMQEDARLGLGYSLLAGFGTVLLARILRQRRKM